MGGTFSKSEKRFTLGQVIGFGLALSLLLNTTPVQAVTDNLNSALVSVLGTVASNSSILADKSSTLASNSTTIATNSGKLSELDNLSSLNTNLGSVKTNIGNVNTSLGNVNTSLGSVKTSLDNIVTKLDSINTKIGSSSGGGGLNIRAIYTAKENSTGNGFRVLKSSVTNVNKCLIYSENISDFNYIDYGDDQHAEYTGWYSDHRFQIIEFY